MLILSLLIILAGVIFGLFIRLLFEKVSSFSTAISWVSLVADAYVTLLQMLVISACFYFDCWCFYQVRSI